VSRFVLPALLATFAVGGPLEAADLVFSPISTCRVIDTRQVAAKFALP
jgi:hypothetical protein